MQRSAESAGSSHKPPFRITMRELVIASLGAIIGAVILGCVGFIWGYLGPWRVLWLAALVAVGIPLAYFILWVRDTWRSIDLAFEHLKSEIQKIGARQTATVQMLSAMRHDADKPIPPDAATESPEEPDEGEDR